MRAVLTLVVAWCSVVAMVRVTGTDANPMIIGLVGVTPLAMLPIWTVAPAAAYLRRSGWIATVALLCIAQLAWAADEWRLNPFDLGPSRGPSTGLIVATGNLFIDNPTPELFVADMLRHRPDVVLLQELTPDAWRRVRELPGLEAYPFRIVDPQDTGLGSAILSRRPLRHGTVLDRDITRWARAEVQWPDGKWVAVVNVHTTSPLDGVSIARWHDELQLLETLAGDTEGALLIAGDFNATVHHDEFQGILHAGLTDAHQQAGRGLGLTWSIGGVPILGLDHVLVNNHLRAVSSESGKGAGSDHRYIWTVVE